MNKCVITFLLFFNMNIFASEVNHNSFEAEAKQRIALLIDKEKPWLVFDIINFGESEDRVSVNLVKQVEKSIYCRVEVINVSLDENLKGFVGSEIVNHYFSFSNKNECNLNLNEYVFSGSLLIPDYLVSKLKNSKEVLNGNISNGVALKLDSISFDYDKGGEVVFRLTHTSIESGKSFLSYVDIVNEKFVILSVDKGEQI